MIITCAKCGRPVQAARQWYDPRTLETVFRVECHGEVEETRVPDIDIAEGIKIVEAVAFRLHPMTGLIPYQ